MFKRAFIILTALLQVSITALSGVGTWERYSAFTGSITRLIDTPSKVYYMSGNYLYDYDKDNDVTTAYSSSTGLSDNKVTMIRYNEADKYLFIAYDTGNIDILYDNGKIVNIPDIADAIINGDKTINNVHFENGKLYVALSFGVVIIDGKKFYVTDSAVYNQNVTAVFPINNALMVVAANNMYAIEEGKSIRSLDQFRKLHTVIIQSFVKLNDTMVAISGSSEAAIYNYTDPLSGTYTVNRHTNLKNLGHFIESEDGIFLNYNNTLWKADTEKLAMVQDKALPDVTKSTVISFNKTPEDLWSGSANGIANYRIDNGEVTVVHDRFKPTDALSVSEPVALFTNKPGDHIYVMNRGMVQRKIGNTANSGRNVRLFTDLIADGNITDVAGAGTKKYSVNNGFKNSSGGSYPVNPQKIVEDPDDPDTYYLVSGSEGVFKIKNNEIIGQFYTANAPFPAPWGIMAYNGAIDKEGNLWIFCGFPRMLPAEKRKLDPSEITIEDWKTYDTTLGLGQDVAMLICEHSDKIFMFDVGYQSNLFVIDTKGTPSNLDDDEIFQISTFVDQDGISNRPLYLLSMTEDHDGKVWIGVTGGVYEISDPQNFTEQNATFNRIKVPRNDGTNYADYLLDSNWIMDITVDNSNRKWIGTSESGLYLVSPSGDQILESFTIENSPLPTNQIATVLADKMSNKVYVGTINGLLSYESDSSPIADNFDNVYAYPNPVRPEYTGWITITNLMENSLVKIADSQGNVIYETTSEGGMATWDGCANNGTRVKTGVYYVFASSGGQESRGAVTKILVVN